MQYQGDAVLRSFIKKVAAPQFVRVAWQAIKAEAPTASRLQEFLDYFEETWLTGNFHLKDRVECLRHARQTKNKQSSGGLAQLPQENRWESSY